MNRLSMLLASQGPGLDLDHFLYEFLLFRPLKPQKASVSFAPMNWPDLLTVWDLLFSRLLYISSKGTK